MWGGKVSAYRGVGWHKKNQKWQARISNCGTSHYIGLFNDEVEAARAYDKAARRLLKERAQLNFPTAAGQTQDDNSTAVSASLQEGRTALPVAASAGAGASGCPAAGDEEPKTVQLTASTTTALATPERPQQQQTNTTTPMATPIMLGSKLQEPDAALPEAGDPPTMAMEATALSGTVSESAPPFNQSGDDADADASAGAGADVGMDCSGEWHGEQKYIPDEQAEGILTGTVHPQGLIVWKASDPPKLQIEPGP